MARTGARLTSPMPPRKQSSPGRQAQAKSRSVPRRTAWGSISRSLIVDAATEVITSGGYEQMTIRSLAERLGVAPMSLYRHVRDRGDLLDEVVDRLLAESWRPSARATGWRSWVEEAAEKLHAFLVSQPAALDVYLSHPVVSPAAVERMHAIMGTLRSAGFDDPSAKRAYAAVHTYTVGFSALEAGRSRWAPPAEKITGLEKQLAAYTTPRQFSEGLKYLLDGVETQLAAAR